MIPSEQELADISRLREGSLEEVPFALLLRALWEHERTVVLEIRRHQLYKRLVLEFGTPVDCQSNLVHERLGRFLVGLGKIDEESANRYLNQAVAQSVPLGNVLVVEGVLTPWELYRILQQNLAKKLLDGFSWSEGEFRMLFDVPEVESSLKVKVPQLILTGLSRFAPQREMDATVMTLIGQKIAVHPSPPVALGELRLTRPQQLLVEHLDRPRGLAELEGVGGLSMDDLSRSVYAFGILGILVPEASLPEEGWAVGAEALKGTGGTTEKAEPGESEAALPEGELERVRNRIMEIYLAHRGQDPFDLFGLEESAGEEERRRAYLAFAETTAPWSLSGAELADLREKATELFLAGARAFGELAESERRNAILFRRQTVREEKERSRKVGPQRIKTDLLDPEVQYRKGRDLMQAGSYAEALQFLDFAADCDPQNGLYRAEAAYCRFLWSPPSAEECLKGVKEACRIDAGCGLAWHYRGELCAELERYDEAEGHYRRAAKQLAGDRRPLDALRELASLRKTGKKRRR